MPVVYRGERSTMSFISVNVTNASSRLTEYTEVFRNSFVVPLEKMWAFLFAVHLCALIWRPGISLMEFRSYRKRFSTPKSPSISAGKCGGATRLAKGPGLRALYLTVLGAAVLRSFTESPPAEFTIYLDRASMIAPRDLKSPLPCADALWNAKTAHEWESAMFFHSTLDPTPACDILKHQTNLEALLSTASKSAFASHVL